MCQRDVGVPPSTLPNQPPTPAPPSHTPPSSPQPSPSNEKYVDKKVFIAGIAIISILLVAVIVLFALGGDKDEEKEEVKDTKTEVREALVEITAEEYSKNIVAADATKKITDLNVVSKAMGIYYVNHKHYPIPEYANYACEPGSGILRSDIEQYY